MKTNLCKKLLYKDHEWSKMCCKYTDIDIHITDISECDMNFSTVICFGFFPLTFLLYLSQVLPHHHTVMLTPLAPTVDIKH